jgi:thiamine pyrophosphate-dependent acetolactate synthase large subunit-like protein
VNVADLVGRAVAELGAAHAFGVVGSGNFWVTNALRAHGVPFTAARHEGGAATMADAFARMSGRVSVLTTHQGCGFTNALTGIGEAAKSRTPMLVLAADTAPADVLSNFRIDQDSAARAVGASVERIYSAETAVDDTTRAYRLAALEHRTVVLNLPTDVQAQAAPERFATQPATQAAMPSTRTVRAEQAAITDLADLVEAARWPIFIAGRGARSASAELRRLADRVGALLATSAVANGLFHDDEWSLGISGGFSSPLTAELIRDADLIVGWGCALNKWTTRGGGLLGAAASIAQVDIEQSALGAHRRVDVGVHGDVALTAGDVETELERRDYTSHGYRTEAVRSRIGRESRWRDLPYDDISTAATIDPRTFSVWLDSLLPAQRIVAVDSGNFMGYPSAYLSVPDENGFCFTQAFQSIGLGLATAIGAATARPDRLPVAALGDGGFLMSVAELETVVRLGLPMLIVVYNDHAYGAEVHHFADGRDEQLETVRFPESDLAAIGRGFGAEGVTVRSVRDMDAINDWLSGPRQVPLVVDVKIASDGGSWWLAEAFRSH